MRTDDMSQWIGRDLRSADDEKVGEIREVYVDRLTREPEWVEVRGGVFGMNKSFVPMARARRQGENIVVPYDKELIRSAPSVEANGVLTEAEERSLYDHYGVDWGGFDYDTDSAGERRSDDAITRAEEEMIVGTRAKETGRARLRKYVVTENVDTTVPIRREAARVEREPISMGDDDEPLEGRKLGEEEHEVVLRAEEPVVEKRVVPRERVRLQKETATDEEEVSGEVRKERIEVEGDVGRRDG